METKEVWTQSVWDTSDNSEWEMQGDALAFMPMSNEAQYKQTLEDVLGPASLLTRTWKDEYEECCAAGYKRMGLPMNPAVETVEKLIEWGVTGITNAMGVGYTQAEAEVIMATINSTKVGAEIGIALAEGSDRHAALTYGVHRALANKARQTTEPAPKCYFQMTCAHKMGLGDKDPRWFKLAESDGTTGFRSMTSFAPMRLVEAFEENYSPDCLKYIGPDAQIHPTDCDVVCFESAPAEQGGTVLHTAVHTGGANYPLPPLTLLTVVKVEEPNTWEYLPGKRINQRLITVRPTYVMQ